MKSVLLSCTSTADNIRAPKGIQSNMNHFLGTGGPNIEDKAQILGSPTVLACLSTTSYISVQQTGKVTALQTPKTGSTVMYITKVAWPIKLLL